MAFSKGVSGNPKGRPVGVGRVAKFKRALERSVPDVIAAVIAAASKGDTAAAKLILDRAVPTLRSVDAPVWIPGAGGDHGDQVRAIVAAAVSGRIGPDAAATLLAGMAAGSRTIEASEFDKRLSALEAKAGSFAQPAPAPANGVHANGNGIPHGNGSDPH